MVALCPQDGEYPLIEFGNLCLTQQQMQICNHNLGSLDHKETNNDSITNECEPFIKNEKQAYGFTVEFTGGFKPNLECLEFLLKFEGQTLLEGDPNSFNLWEYDENLNQIVFNVSHADIDNFYNCEFIESYSSYNWVCDMSLHILFGGIEQLQYDFKIQITLNREAKATQNADGEDIIISVERSIITGICCENELEIETALRFCTDMTCTGYLDAPLSVERGVPFVVEHYIVTPEFRHYYLKGLQITLGPYLPTVLDTDGEEPGRFIWKIKANIAMDNILVSSISQIFQEKPVYRRRMLSEIRDDYKVMGLTQISVLDEQAPSQKTIEQQQSLKLSDQYQNSQNDQQQLDQNGKFLPQRQRNVDNTLLIIAVIAVGLITVFSVMGAIYYCIVSKKYNNNKEKEKQGFDESNPDSIIEKVREIH